MRLRQHEENAARIAEHLASHGAVRKVYYPGLAEHPGHALAARQQQGFGAMLSFELHGGEEAARCFLEDLGQFTLAESLGGVESLVCHPASMTHAPVSAERKAAAGVTLV